MGTAGSSTRTAAARSAACTHMRTSELPCLAAPPRRWWTTWTSTPGPRNSSRRTRRFRRAVRDGDVVSRLGGEEFAVILPGASREAAVEVAGRIRETLEERFSVSGATVDIDGSIGIALYPEDATDVSTLLQRADLAMYKAKETHSGHTFYSEELDHGH